MYDKIEQAATTGQPVSVSREEAIRIAEMVGAPLDTPELREFFGLTEREVEEYQERRNVQEAYESEHEGWSIG